MRTHAGRLVFAVVFALGACGGSLSQPFYKEPTSVHTIRYDGSTPPNVARSPGCASSGQNEREADVGVVEFGEDGAFLDRGQLQRVLECITRAQQANSNGAVVMVFVHGWRHDASWEDQNFRDFRTVLLSLALREAERFRTQRRVVGVYLGWPGGRVNEFTKRYRVAQVVGRGDAMSETIREIVRTTKAPTGRQALGSPVVLVGHSMGAMALQTAFDSLLERGQLGADKASPADERRCARIYRGGQVVGGFPDLVLSLNSATDSQITRGLIKRFQELGLSKIVDCGNRRFEAPIMISASSVDDYATTWLYWAASLGRGATDGNDKELINHRLRPAGAYKCPPIGGVPDYGQSWHCLREPAVQQGQLLKISVDLPQFELERDPCHLRYQLSRTAAPGAYLPLWVFQVPGELIEDHGDIFNGRSRLLAMALIQVSGATMSVFDNYGAMFESELSPCTLPR